MLALSALAPLAGVLVYAGWRDVLPAFLAPLLGSPAGHRLHAFRKWAQGAWDMPLWLAHSLPDGLWGMGLSALLAALWWETPQAPRIVGLSALAVPLWEALQSLGILQGTACPVDALFGLACALPVWVWTVFRKD
jgi:hypothetical protein